MAMLRFVVDKIRSLSRHGLFHFLGSHAMNQVISFAYGVIILRVITKAEYGIFAYANNVYMLIALLSGLGIVSATMQLGSEYADDEHKTRCLFAYSYRFSFLCNCILSLLILMVAFLLPIPILGSKRLLIMMALLPIPTIIKDLQIVWLRIKKRNRAYATANTTSAVITAAFVIGGAALYAEKGIVIAQYLAAFAVILLLLRMKAPIIVSGAVLEPGDRKELYQIAGVSVLNNTLSELFSLLGTFMLGLVVADESIIASYKIATTIPFALSFVPVSVMMFVYPYFARNRTNRKWVKRNYLQLLLVVAAGNALMTVGAAFFAGPIVGLVFGAAYLDAVPSFRILMVSYFFSGTLRVVSGNLLVTQRKLVSNLIIGIVGASCTIMFNIMLIPTHASQGAAVSHTITSFVTGALSTILMTHAIRKIPVES